MIESRRLGESSLRVTRLGFGLAALGRPGYITIGHAQDLRGGTDIEAMRRHSWSALDLAWELGIRYFDTARGYGRAEEFLASWLAERTIPPERCTVGSKWGYIYAAEWRVDAEVHEIKDHSLPTLKRQRRESHQLLGEYLDLYQIHSATESSGVLDRADVLDALARLKAEGRLAAIGLTLSGPDSARTLERALGIRRDGRLLFDTVQATWNVLEPSLGSLLADARSAGIGVIIKEALANGRLTARNSDPSFAERRDGLEREAERLGCSVDQLALAAALDQPWADCVLSGAATVQHLRSNAGALDVELDDRARSALASLSQPSADYWAERAELRWQ